MCNHGHSGEAAPFRAVCHLLAPHAGRGRQLWEASVPSEAQSQPFRWAKAQVCAGTRDSAASPRAAELGEGTRRALWAGEGGCRMTTWAPLAPV